MKKRILVAPLDWGLGHATRCIPVIRELLFQGAEVLIAADGRPFELLQKEFPRLELIRLPGYEISYPQNGNMLMSMFFQFPKLVKKIYQEHHILNKIIQEKKIDVVISDNRFGLWNSEIHSIYITHQVLIKCPPFFKLMEPVLYSFNSWIINKYDECWIPDEAGDPNYSGDLSHRYPLPKNATYIGIQSRFSETNDTAAETKKYDLMFVLSGPEPQRTVFEENILGQLKNLSLKSVLVRGTPGEEFSGTKTENTTIISHLDSKEMQKAILSSDLIISRSGYSTVMDLAVLGKKAVFVPTPGQTEQEYLAARFKSGQVVYSETQEEFELKRCLTESKKYKGFSLFKSSEIVRIKVSEILSE